MFLTNDATIQALNQQYRNKDQPTDVLSFSQLEGVGLACNMLGDIVISTETAVRQAEERGLSVPEELLRLVIHGLLHLAGFEHENVPAKIRRQMQDQEDQLQQLYLKESKSWIA